MMLNVGLLCLFLSVCFHAVRGIHLKPTYYVLFKTLQLSSFAAVNVTQFFFLIMIKKMHQSLHYVTSLRHHISMTTLLEHNLAQPTEGRILPKNLSYEEFCSKNFEQGFCPKNFTQEFCQKTSELHMKDQNHQLLISMI